MAAPIDRLLDKVEWRCTVCNTLATVGCHCHDQLTPELKQALTSYASHVARQTLAHIDQMYPAMWQGVPKSARVSVRNCIRNAVTQILTEILTSSGDHEPERHERRLEDRLH